MLLLIYLKYQQLRGKIGLKKKEKVNKTEGSEILWDEFCPMNCGRISWPLQNRGVDIFRKVREISKRE